VAVPTASPDTSEALKAEAEDVVCVITPEPFLAVGYWYDDFAQTTDAEVRELLARSQSREVAPRSNSSASGASALRRDPALR
jgi:predicted phosphoribosyltransferase